MPSEHVADDLRQETFARVMAELHREGGIRQPQRFGAFVMSICNNVIQEYHRSSSKNQPIEDTYKDMSDTVSDLEGFARHQAISGANLPNSRRNAQAGPRPSSSDLLEEKEKGTVCRELGVDREQLTVLMHRAKDKFKSHGSPPRRTHSDTRRPSTPVSPPTPKRTPAPVVVRRDEQVPSIREASSTEQILHCPAWRSLIFDGGTHLQQTDNGGDCHPPPCRYAIRVHEAFSARQNGKLLGSACAAAGPFSPHSELIALWEYLSEYSCRLQLALGSILDWPVAQLVRAADS